jgi:hypothetical protein
MRGGVAMGETLWTVACAYALSALELRRRLDALAEQLDVKFQGVIVDNQQSEVPSADDCWTYIAGSNGDHDFSAYIEGLELCIEKAGEPLDTILFVNDSLFTLHSAHANARETVAYAGLLRQLKVPSICGKTDTYAALCHQSPWSGLPLYVSSFCFLLNRPAFDILRALPHWADEDGLDRDLAVSDPQWAERLLPSFREFIRAYVSYGNSWFVWPGLKRYAVNDRLIAIKARCIYLEHRLSGEIARVGCLISTNERALPRLRLYVAEKASALRRKLGLQ